MARVSATRVSPDRLPLITKVARLYHEHGVRQPEIARRLSISQSRVSRLLKEAVEIGIVRTVVIQPPTVHSELEDEVRDTYGLTDVLIADSAADDEASILAAISGTTAAYFETTLTGQDRVGISSWSSTLLAAVDKMVPRNVSTASVVVQVLGGLGAPSVQMKATHLVERLSAVTGALPIFFSAPGVVASGVVRDAILADTSSRKAVEEWGRLTVLVAGIGSIAPSPMLKDSGNAVSSDELEKLSVAGAVGDVCLHFFDNAGRIVETDFSTRTVGISAEDMRRVPRRVGVAGGERKWAAIRAALAGHWVDVLITDVLTAKWLVANPIAMQSKNGASAPLET